MQQSYEGLDRPGGFSRVRLLAPLSHRDYRLLVGGMSVSLLGDAFVLVALAVAGLAPCSTRRRRCDGRDRDDRSDHRSAC